jgi:hypothetical protein
MSIRRTSVDDIPGERTASNTASRFLTRSTKASGPTGIFVCCDKSDSRNIELVAGIKNGVKTDNRVICQSSLATTLTDAEARQLDVCDVVVFLCTRACVKQYETVCEILHYCYEEKKYILAVFVDDCRRDLKLSVQIMLQCCPTLSAYESHLETSLYQLLLLLRGIGVESADSLSENVDRRQSLTREKSFRGPRSNKYGSTEPKSPKLSALRHSQHV